MEAVSEIQRRYPQVPTSALLPFVAITFLITWGLVGVYILFPERAASLFGQISGSHPLFFVATWAPALSAFAIVFWYTGIAGVGAFLSRLLLWRCPAWWAIFILAGVPVLFLAGSLLKGNLSQAFVFESGGALFGAMIVMLFLGPIEEFGWRGVAQPLLQRMVAPFWAGIVIGATWGIWHLPAFHLSGTLQSGWAFWPFFIGNVALALIVTPLFNASRGSILLPLLLHWQLINPVWPDAQPYDIWFFVAAAAVITWLNRKTIFTRTGAAVAVIARTVVSR